MTDVSGGQEASSPDASSGDWRKGRMTIGDIFSRSFEIYRANPILIVPSLIPMVWAIVGSMVLLAGLLGYVGMGALFGGNLLNEGWLFGIITGAFLFLLVLIVLFFLAECMTIEMIHEAYRGGSANLSLAWRSAKDRIGTLIAASVISGLLIAAGLVMLIVPGLILMLLLYFVAQAIIIDRNGAVEALSASYEFVRANLEDSIVVVLITLCIYLLLGIIPYVGNLLTLVATPFIMGISTILYIDRKVA